jgi:hypothetical protein
LRKAKVRIGFLQCDVQVLTFAFIPDEFDSDVGEDELDEELALPEVLRTISYEEKRELYRFKHTHNEVEWGLHPPPLTGVIFVAVSFTERLGGGNASALRSPGPQDRYGASQAHE